MDSFVQHLREIDNGKAISWCRVPKHSDPPDFWITVAGTKYAVEVTSIVVDEGYHALCRKLLESIQTECDANDDIDGLFDLHISRRPKIPKRGTSNWNKLVATALAHMPGLSTASSEDLLKDANGTVTLRKVSDHGSAIRSEAKWEGEVQEQLSERIQNAIDEKREKIEEKGILEPCILLLYDAYGYGDIEDAQQALLQAQGYKWFHSIFWAASFSDRQNLLFPDSPGRGGAFLYSKNGEWWQET